MRLDTTDLPGYDLRVDATLRIKSKSLGGDTSSTDRAHLGYQPKTLAVALRILRSKPGDLTTITSLVEALDRDGKPKIYTVVDDLARAVKIKKVRFNENFRVTESADRREWNVTFELVEYRSIPEKIESRLAPADVQAQAAPTGSKTVAAAAAPELAGFENVLKKIDQVLAPNETPKKA